MRFKPSALEQYIATLPEELQIPVLNAITEEYNRLARGDFTSEEKNWMNMAGELGKAAAIYLETRISEVFNNEKTISQ